MAQTRFPTLTEALGAGYRRCGAKYGDVDTSGGSYHGYSYCARDGRTSVNVSLIEERSAGGTRGCYMPLMPLNEGITAEQEAWAVTAEYTRADIESGW